MQQRWLNSDNNDPGYQIYSEDEILSLATEENKSEESSDDEQTVDLGPSNAEAFCVFETAINWYEKQAECCFPQFDGVKTNSRFSHQWYR